MNSTDRLARQAVTVLEIEDAIEADAGLESLSVNAVQLQTVQLKARRIILRAGTTTAIYQSCNASLRSRTSFDSGQVAYVTFGSQARGTVNGIPVRPGLILAVAAETEVCFVVQDGWESMTFLMPPDDIIGHLSARGRDGECHIPQQVEILEADPEAVGQLFTWGRQLAEMAASQIELFNQQQDELAAVETDVIERLLATIGKASVFKSSRSDQTRQRRSQIVKVAEEYALSRNGADIYVTDLCRVTGVSERALEYAFKEVVGMTPMAFLTRLRLHRVRESLLEANPKSTTVASEALRWGFWHFGEFAHVYKSCFGELPSDTLLRAGQ